LDAVRDAIGGVDSGGDLGQWREQSTADPPSRRPLVQHLSIVVDAAPKQQWH
jgi:hypothetical protein